MGYSEVLCYLCGVSFNIGRIRTANEPREAAWNCYGQNGINCVTHGFIRIPDECYSPSGPCCAVKRELKQKNNSERDEEEDDQEIDPDYLYASDSNDEPLEYDSDVDIDDSDYDDTTHDNDDDDEDDDDSDGDSDGDDLDSLLYRTWLSSFKEEHEEEDTFLALPTVGQVNPENYDQIDNMEHIAGPNCVVDGGYSGHRITVEEMKGCLTVQCLMRKGRAWIPASDDQEFELSSNYFLSGLCDHMPSRDEYSPKVIPARHDVEYPDVDDIVWEHFDDPDMCGMPFHPWCFDIFARLSRLHIGRVDVNGLMGWRNLKPGHNAFRSFPRDEAVTRANEQWWLHEHGSEYLAANPLFIPRLQSILDSAIQEDMSGFIGPQGAFINSNNSDPFMGLPPTIRLEIVDYLDSRSIANLRLTSQAFRRLPVSLWYRLLRQEMPWLWEIWSDQNPYFWATLTEKDIRAIPSLDKKVSEEFRKEILHYRNVIKSDMPSFIDTWQAAEPDINQLLGPPGCSWPPAVVPPVRVPSTGTNWYQLYTDITRHWGELKGLQNRRRIWKYIEWIVQKISEEREQGRIVD